MRFESDCAVPGAFFSSKAALPRSPVSPKCHRRCSWQKRIQVSWRNICPLARPRDARYAGAASGADLAGQILCCRGAARCARSAAFVVGACHNDVIDMSLCTPCVPMPWLPMLCLQMLCLQMLRAQMVSSQTDCVRMPCFCGVQPCPDPFCGARFLSPFDKCARGGDPSGPSVRIMDAIREVLLRACASLGDPVATICVATLMHLDKNVCETEIARTTALPEGVVRRTLCKLEAHCLAARRGATRAVTRRHGRKVQRAAAETELPPPCTWHVPYVAALNHVMYHALVKTRASPRVRQECTFVCAACDTTWSVWELQNTDFVCPRDGCELEDSNDTVADTCRQDEFGHLWELRRDVSHKPCAR